MKYTPILFFLSISAFLFSCKKTVSSLPKPPVVDAGVVQTIKLPTDNVTLTGVVTDAGSKIVGYLWSEVSGPNVPVIASESSITTKVTGLVQGSYIFQLMAVDSFGLTGVDTMHVIVKAPDSIVLQPANNPTDIYYALAAGQDWTQSTAPDLDACAWTIGGQLETFRSAVKFDLSSLPNQQIKSASLTLYSYPSNPPNGNQTTANAGTANAFYIQRITSAWSPSTASWATQPSVDAASQILIPHTDKPFLDVTTDVTTMVNTMISSGNYGFFVRLQNEVVYNSRLFCSSRYSDATKHPRLVISY